MCDFAGFALGSLGMKILRFEKRLAVVAVPQIPGVRFRWPTGPDDVTAWLRLRREAFAGMLAPGRDWTAADFEREFTSRPWWTAEAMWLAETVASPAVVGSVVLGRSGRSPDDRPSIQWLMVAPEFRGRGLGRALLAAAERAACDRGETSLTLETHADWRDAVRLYEQTGWVRWPERGAKA
jgi:GNAT superfamily N-acetyltransferase